MECFGSSKKEFNSFGGVLEKAQKKINEANKEIETLVGTRTRMMQSKLKNVEQLEVSKTDESKSNFWKFKIKIMINIILIKYPIKIL